MICGSAVISQCGTYRYRLERDLGRDGKTAAIIMVNPSTADADVDDHTIRKWLGFARRFEIGRFIVGNKFAYRATNIRELRVAADPIGPKNDQHLEQIMRDADLHIVAWGSLGKLPVKLRPRWREIVQISQRVGCSFVCLGMAKDGHPLHPLMRSFEAQLVEWTLPT